MIVSRRQWTGHDLAEAAGPVKPPVVRLSPLLSAPADRRQRPAQGLGRIFFVDFLGRVGNEDPDHRQEGARRAWTCWRRKSGFGRKGPYLAHSRASVGSASATRPGWARHHRRLHPGAGEGGPLPLRHLPRHRRRPDLRGRRQPTAVHHPVDLQALRLSGWRSRTGAPRRFWPGSGSSPAASRSTPSSSTSAATGRSTPWSTPAPSPPPR